ncbi:amidohydrolase family protein [Proteus vulgaris]|uniref:amidohydrolase family protein n=1 Tax=Proteus vulgaris TaxID=585 RepID=UPI0018E4D8C8|nr:amidohydrolase family protein [Proteus vulgaris]MBI6530999.1 amidohydrolase family protein [Proteus vulgaris]
MTDNKNTISRRSFIKAAGVGSLGLALTTPNNASAISSSLNKENRDYIATKKSKKIIYNGYVITMDEKYGDLENGAVLIENDTIIDVGDISKFAHIDAELIDAEGGIILPGIIDSHRHTWMSLLRSISADMSLAHFLNSVFYGIGALMEAEDLKMATLVGSLEALDAGVTTILDCCDCVNTPQHAVAAIGSLRESGIRSIYAYGMQSYDYKGENRFKTHSQRIDTAKEIYQNFYKNNNTINKMGVLLSDFGTIPFEHTRQEIEQAKKMGIFIASHTGAAEKSILLKGLHELKQNNLLHPGHLHIHCTSLDRSEWDILSQTGGKISIAPETEMQMGMGRPPFRASIDHGFKPGLSTDIVCVGSGDLFSQMRLGLQFQRCMDNEATANRTGKTTTHIDLSVRDALTWATQGSAEALGMEKQIGTLTPNKKADIIIVSQRKAFVPSSYPAGSVVLQTTASDVDTVIINGEVKKRFGKLLHHDVEKIRTEATATLKRIQEKAKNIPNVSPEEIAQFFDVAQEQARENFAQAYKK